MTKEERELIEKLYSERGIHIFNPSNFKIVKKGPVIVEVKYSGFIHIDKLPGEE